MAGSGRRIFEADLGVIDAAVNRGTVAFRPGEAKNGFGVALIGTIIAIAATAGAAPLFPDSQPLENRAVSPAPEVDVYAEAQESPGAVPKPLIGVKAVEYRPVPPSQQPA